MACRRDLECHDVGLLNAFFLDFVVREIIKIISENHRLYLLLRAVYPGNPRATVLVGSVGRYYYSRPANRRLVSLGALAVPAAAVAVVAAVVAVAAAVVAVTFCCSRWFYRR